MMHHRQSPHARAKTPYGARLAIVLLVSGCLALFVVSVGIIALEIALLRRTFIESSARNRFRMTRILERDDWLQDNRVERSTSAPASALRDDVVVSQPVNFSSSRNINRALLNELHDVGGVNYPMSRNSPKRGGFLGESDEAFDKRMREWTDLVRRLIPNVREGYVVSPKYLHTMPDTHAMFRTAVAVTWNSFVLAFFSPRQSDPSNDPRVQQCEPSCRCFMVGPVKLVCQLEPSVPRAVADTYTHLTLISYSPTRKVVIPIERPLPLPPPRVLVPQQRETIKKTSPKRVSICLQGVLWKELALGEMPDEMVKTYIAHYARLGATEIHLYTRNGYAIDKFTRLSTPCGGQRQRSSSSWCRVRVVMHDSPVPEYAVPKEEILPSAQGFQLFAMEDCMARSFASGADWTVVADMDEFVFPSSGEAGLELAEALERASSSTELGRPATIEAWDSVSALNVPPWIRGPHDVVYFKSLMFHTIACAAHPKHPNRLPNHYRDFLNHFAFAYDDRESYAGRRKYALRLSTLGVDSFLASEFRIHDASGPEMTATDGSSWVHVHHTRDSWHSRVCSVVKPAGTPRVNEGAAVYRLHRPDHEAVLRDMEEVWGEGVSL